MALVPGLPVGVSGSRTAPASGITSADAAARLARDGPNEVPEQRRHPLLQFARRFWGLSAWMIEAIAVLSFVLHKHADFIVAVALLVVNAVLGFIQEQRATSAVAALRRRLKITARVRRDGTWQLQPARELVVGDLVRVRSGDFVPADARVVDGSAQLDESTLTGETRAVDRRAGEQLYAGSTVTRGEATAIVTATGLGTYFGRTTDLVQRAQPKLHVEDVISRVVRWLFVIVSVLVAIALAVSMTEGLPLEEILPLALVLLMSAVPVALPVMFTVSMAVGSVELARRGVLVTRLSAAEDAAEMDVLCADKTGTLTLNRLTLGAVLPQAGFSPEDVVRDGAWASSDADQDPIDRAFLDAARIHHIDPPALVTSFTPFSPDTRRTEAAVVAGGRPLRVTKGALRTIAALAGVPPEAVAAVEARAAEPEHAGARLLAVARADEGGSWQMVGAAFLADPIRSDSRALIDGLRDLGVGVKMLTGDALPVANAVARELGLPAVTRAPGKTRTKEDVLDAEGAGGYAEILPADKFAIVHQLQATGHVVGMTGDGVNDAPALRQAEVGIAVSGATDVAKGAASVVLTTEGLANVVDLVTNGRAIYQRVLTWIINKISRTLLKSGFVVVAFLVTGRFVISALGMVLLVFLTDFAKVSLATDSVRASSKPESWNIGPLVRVAVVLGLCMLAESLVVLAIGWRAFDLGAHQGRLETFTFETLLFFALFSIVSIRERRAFWSSQPGRALLLALSGDAIVGLLIGLFGIGELAPLPVRPFAFLLAFSLVCSLLVNDLIKVTLLRRNVAVPPPSRSSRNER